MPEKVRAIIRWALEHGYDRVIKCDDDVVIQPVYFLRALHCGDFVSLKSTSTGRGRQLGVEVPWGFFYNLSKRAMEIMAVAELPIGGNDEEWVAITLASHGIAVTDDSRLYVHRLRNPITKVQGRRHLRRAVITYDPPVPESYAYCLVSWAGWNAIPPDVGVDEYMKVWNTIKAQGKEYDVVTNQ